MPEIEFKMIEEMGGKRRRKKVVSLLIAVGVSASEGEARHENREKLHAVEFECLFKQRGDDKIGSESDG